MIIRKANTAEYQAVRQFYYDLIDDMAGLPYHPKWQKGIYPADEYLAASIGAGELLIAEDAGRIVGAMIVNHHGNDGYLSASWGMDAGEAETTVIHALGVAVARMGTGVGKAMVRHVLRLAAETGQKVIRLDVIDGNEPARRLYQGQGFRFVQRVNLYYEDTGWCDFDLYEYPIG